MNSGYVAYRMLRRAGLCLIAALMLAGCGKTAERNAVAPADSQATALAEGADTAVRIPEAESAQAEVTPEPSPEPAGEPPKSYILCGREIPADCEELDLSDLTSENVNAAAEILEQLTMLKTVILGEHADGEEARLSWAEIRQLEQAAPNAVFDYTFTLFGKLFTLADTKMNLNHISMEDEGALVREVIACMPDLEYLDMDTCGVSDEAMASIRDAFPQVRVVWRIWFGNCYSVRTDVEKILASNPDGGGQIKKDNGSGLQYCTDVRYLDLGHNDYLGDISFVANMPKLEVAILAMTGTADISAIANCTELEFLELQTNRITDLTPLSGLTKLRHLNICYNENLDDITPLYSLTGLERLWIGCMNQVPKEQIEEMQRLAPECNINDWCVDPHDFWRTGDRYLLLSTQFGYVNADAHYAYYWNDPLYYGQPEGYDGSGDATAEE